MSAASALHFLQMQLPILTAEDPPRDMLVSEAGYLTQEASLVPAEAHYTGLVHNKGTKTRLRISNGGGMSLLTNSTAK